MKTPTTPEEWNLQLASPNARASSIDAYRQLLKTHQNRYLAPLIQPGMKILEAGCGNGRYVLSFAANDAIGIGLDFSHQLVENVATRARQAKINHVLLVTANIFTIPFKDKSLDLYTSFGVYEHFRPREHYALLREAYRILKPGGLVYIEVPHLWSLWTIRREIRYWCRRIVPPKLVWQRNMSRNQLVQAAEEYGFHTLESHIFDAWSGLEKGLSLHQKCLKGLPNLFFYLRHVFGRLANFCDHYEIMGHTLVYIGKRR